jgi:hypothetical protein
MQQIRKKNSTIQPIMNPIAVGPRAEIGPEILAISLMTDLVLTDSEQGLIVHDESMHHAMFDLVRTCDFHLQFVASAIETM